MRALKRSVGACFAPLLAIAVGFASTAALAVAQAPAGQPADPPAAAATPPEDEKIVEPPKLPDPAGAKKLPDPDRVWVDAKKKQVLVDGYVSLREGYLEMFACKVQSKEHESVVAVQAQMKTIHAALLALGAKSGKPVQFRPEFKPPTGMEIDVEVRWLDAKGAWKSARAQEWIKNSETGEPMQHPWVFAGSGFWKDPDTGKERYLAEQGDFICVSNFTTAMLDIPIESSQSNDGLIFVANPDKIPRLGTPIRLVLTPKLEAKKPAPPAAPPAPPAAPASPQN